MKKRKFWVEVVSHKTGKSKILEYTLTADEMKFDIDDYLIGTSGIVWDVVNVNNYYANGVYETDPRKTKP